MRLILHLLQVYRGWDTNVPRRQRTAWVNPDAPTQAATAVPMLGEGKKFFLAPSLVAGAGAASTVVSKPPSGTRVDCDPRPLATLSLRYETAGTLLLRGILRRGNPGHAAILDACPGEAGWLVAACCLLLAACCLLELPSSEGGGCCRGTGTAPGRRHALVCAAHLKYSTHTASTPG